MPVKVMINDKELTKVRDGDVFIGIEALADDLTRRPTSGLRPVGIRISRIASQDENNVVWENIANDGANVTYLNGTIEFFSSTNDREPFKVVAFRDAWTASWGLSGDNSGPNYKQIEHVTLIPGVISIDDVEHTQPGWDTI